ncbi:MAG: metallophosphoesterase [Micrococcaceae bacterium]
MIRHPLAVGVLTAATLAAATAAYGVYETRRFTVRRETLPLLPAGAAPIRVLHLSDIHLMPRDTAKLAWLRGLDAQLQPDLVINTGDNIGSAASIPLLLDALEPLLSRPGVFVPGSNDYYAPKPLINPFKYFSGPSSTGLQREQREELARRRLPSSTLFAAFEHTGWLNLTNTTARMQIGATEIGFAGTDDPHLDLDRWPGFDADSPALRLGVTHAPYRRVLDAMRDDGADAMFAGHTHGGQVCLPFYGALVTNCDLPTRYASGLHHWHGTPFNVSAGIGAAPAAPVRIACRPEAVVVDLVAP